MAAIRVGKIGDELVPAAVLLSISLSFKLESLDLRIKEGDSVKAGDVLMIMEAMKMENNIVAPGDGTVTSVKVAKGDNVLEGDPLVEIGG